MKNITILGWFGSGNLGDDTILFNEINLLKTIYKDSKITVLAGNPLLVCENFYGIDSMKLPPIMWYRYYKFININYLFKLIYLFKNTDLLVLGGGGFFSDRQFFAIKGWLTYCKIAKYFGAKVIGLGMGAGPFYYKINKNLIKESSKIFDFVSVRDKTSFSNMIETGFDRNKLFKTIDPAFFTEYKKNTKINSIGFIIHSNYEYFIKEILNILSNSTYSIKLIITDDLDISINEKIINEIGNNRCCIVKKKSPTDVIEEISMCDFIVSQRLHGSIISFSQEIPFLNIYYHHKGKELIELLGIENFSVDISILEEQSVLDYILRKDSFKFKDLSLNVYKLNLLKLLGKIN